MGYEKERASGRGTSPCQENEITGGTGLEGEGDADLTLA